MLLLTAYIDESGYGDQGIIVMGGFFGRDADWGLCGREWRSALGQRKGLHMSKLRWKNTKRIQALLKRLGPIPHECGLIPVWARLRVSDYSDLVEQTTLSRKLQHGYFVAAEFLGLILMNYVRLLDERIKIVFEYNEHFDRIIPVILKAYSMAFPAFVNHGVPCLAGVEFVPKDSTCLTQPADYLTYARLQEMRDPNSLRTRLCSPILERQPGVHVDVSRNAIRQLMSSKSQQELRELAREMEPHIQMLRKLHGKRKK
ncbi:MAG TPA: DUF3800 domain-containing protein [Terriglobales bacterium]|nr:DUF3800 domain-containing protein [Terriglobales bacterium]